MGNAEGFDRKNMRSGRGGALLKLDDIDGFIGIILRRWMNFLKVE